MPNRRTLIIGGEIYIKNHRGNIAEIKEIMDELKHELDKNKTRREELKKL